MDQDFTLEEAVVALPRRNGRGDELTVRIRALSKAEMLELWKGMPSARVGATTDVSELHEEVQQKLREELEAAARKIVQLAVVEPRFAFEPGAGVQWDGLHVENQAAIVAAIYAHSGLEMPAGEAKGVLSFRYVERGGVPVREGTGGAVPAAAPAA